MTLPSTEEEIRARALSWIDRETLSGALPITRDQLANKFTVGGQRFPLVDRGAEFASRWGGDRRSR